MEPRISFITLGVSDLARSTAFAASHGVPRAHGSYEALDADADLAGGPLLDLGTSPAIRDVLDMLLARARIPIRVHVDSARFRPNDVPLLLGDPARAREELGWTPLIPLEQTIDDVLGYWRGVISAA